MLSQNGLQSLILPLSICAQTLNPKFREQSYRMGLGFSQLPTSKAVVLHFLQKEHYSGV